MYCSHLNRIGIIVTRFLKSGFRLLGVALSVFSCLFVCLVILLIRTLIIASEFAIIVTGVPCALTFKSGLFFKDCFVVNEKVCFSSLSLSSLSETSFLSKRRVFRLSPLPLDTISKWFHLPHLLEVWSYAELAVLPPWRGYFDPFCLISVSPDRCCVTFRNVIWQTEQVPS